MYKIMDPKLNDVNDVTTFETLRTELDEKCVTHHDVEGKTPDAFTSYRTLKNKKLSVVDTRASVFDWLYGKGAHSRAQLFLDGYKIPKRLPSSETDATTKNKQKNTIITSISDLNFESGNDSDSSSSESNSPNSMSADDAECTVVLGSSVGDTLNLCSVEDDFMDILIITAEDDEIPLPT